MFFAIIMIEGGGGHDSDRPTVALLQWLKQVSGRHGLAYGRYPIKFKPPEGGGGGRLPALEMGRSVPPACSKPDPVPIRLVAKKFPYPNLEINTEFN